MGGLAEQAHIPFLYVPFTKPGFVPSAEKGQLFISDFTQLYAILRDNFDKLQQGESFSSIFFGKEYDVLFPPPPEGQLYERMMRR